MSEQRSSEWLSIETMRPPSETEVWLYAKIDGAEITKKGRISKTHPSEPTVYQQWDDTRGPPPVSGTLAAGTFEVLVIG
jgi:hypothetical protein